MHIYVNKTFLLLCKYLFESHAPCLIVGTSWTKHFVCFVNGIPWEFCKKFLGDNWFAGCSTGFEEGKSKE